ncbi:hypothetical protein ACROYT_G039731 [Oculina patagonica]
MGTILFKGDIPLEEFLAQNKPSSIDISRNKWVQVKNPNCQSERNPQTKALCKEWQERLTKPASEGRINYDFVKDLAGKYNYKTGKWLVYLPRAEIDAAWESIAKAVVSGSLGHCAKSLQFDGIKR